MSGQAPIIPAVLSLRAIRIAVDTIAGIGMFHRAEASGVFPFAFWPSRPNRRRAWAVAQAGEMTYAPICL